MKSIAARALCTREKWFFGLILAGGLAACSSLPQPPVRARVYDFGPGRTAAAAAQGTLPAIILGEVRVSGQPEAETALNYRLAYANAPQLHPYRDARWSQSPSALLAQALRARLGEERPVLPATALGQSLAGDALPDVLRVELEEFSQVFSTPEASHALVRLRASLSRVTRTGEQWRAQRLFIVQRPAATPDAAGGAQALADAAAQAADDVARWLESLP